MYSGVTIVSSVKSLWAWSLHIDSISVTHMPWRSEAIQKGHCGLSAAFWSPISFYNYMLNQVSMVMKKRQHSGVMVSVVASQQDSPSFNYK